MIPIPRDSERRLLPFALYTYGRVEIQFQYLARQPPFDDEQLREEFRQRLNAVEGIAIPTGMLTVRPSIPLAALVPPDALAKFLAVIEWAFDQRTPSTTA